MSQRTHLIIAERSDIIRNGLLSILQKFTTKDLDFAEISDDNNIIEQIDRYKPDILIINTSYLNKSSLEKIRANSHLLGIKIIALQCNLLDKKDTEQYDDIIYTYDSASSIKEKIKNIIKLENFKSTKEFKNKKQELSKREKEIVICVAKGMTNKEIADKLFLSLHTITTHRRNISAKLQIHSSAGLTIYAIVNNLIDIENA